MNDLGTRVLPDLETRLAEVVRSFRAEHRHPLNLALHAAASLVGLTGATRLLRGELLAGAGRIALAGGLLLAGHRIEGNEPFAFLRRLQAD